MKSHFSITRPVRMTVLNFLRYCYYLIPDDRMWNNEYYGAPSPGTALFLLSTLAVTGISCWVFIAMHKPIFIIAWILYFGFMFSVRSLFNLRDPDARQHWQDRLDW